MVWRTLICATKSGLYSFIRKTGQNNSWSAMRSTHILPWTIVLQPRDRQSSRDQPSLARCTDQRGCQMRLFRKRSKPNVSTLCSFLLQRLCSAFASAPVTSRWIRGANTFPSFCAPHRDSKKHHLLSRRLEALRRTFESVFAKALINIQHFKQIIWIK